MAFPGQPLFVPPTVPQDQALLSLISQNMAPRQAELQNQIGSLSGLLEAALAAEAPGPQQVPVPGRTDPFAQMAATFAGSLAEQLGSPGAAGAVRSQIAQHEQAAQRAEQQNLAFKEQARRERLQHLLDMRQQLSDAKIEALKEGNDLKSLEAELQKRFQIDAQMERLKQENKEALEARRHEGRMEEIQARGSEQRRTSAARNALSTSTNPRAKALLQNADEQAEAIRRTSEGMRQQNERALSAFQEPPFTEEEIRIQENRERLEIDRIYMRNLDALESGKDLTSPAPASKPDLNSFFKK